MPGSLLTPRDPLSDRSDASYASADSRTSGKKVSFNKAVRVKQYPWTPDYSYSSPEDLPLPARRFWFRVYKVRPQGGDRNGCAPLPVTSWEEENAEDTYDSLAPIVEDDGTDDRSYGDGTRNGQTLSRWSHLRDAETKEVGGTDPQGYVRLGSSKPNTVINGLRAVLSKSQAKLQGDRREVGSVAQSDLKHNRPTSPHKYSCLSSIARDGYGEEGKSAVVVRIPRAESPIRGRDGIERFSMRYRTSLRKSRSTDEGNRDRRSMSVDKAVSTDDLDGTALRASKDKSTQCNGTLIRSKPLTAYGTPRLSRSLFTNKTSEPSDPRATSQNGNYPAKRLGSDPDSDRNSSRCPRQSESRNAKKTEDQIITKPRIASNSHRLQRKENGPSNGSGGEHKSNLNSSATVTDTSNGFGDASSPRLYERGRGSNSVPQDGSRLQWCSTPLAERRERSWERSTRPAAATVGYQRGRHVSTHGRQDDSRATRFEAGRSLTTASKFKDESNLPNAKRGENGFSARREEGAHVTKSASGLVPSEDMIDWSTSGFHLGPVGRGLVSGNECLVHQRAPLLMYIPGVSHHEKPALEDDRMSGISGLSRADLEDELKPLTGVKNSYIFSRRNSMPKDPNKSWAKWKSGRLPR